MSEAAQLARALSPRARRSGKNWLTLCPGHNDRKTLSLSITDCPGTRLGILFHCFGGCDGRRLAAILEAYLVVGALSNAHKARDGAMARYVGATGADSGRTAGKWAGARRPGATPSCIHHEWGEPAQVWTYRRPDGADWCYVARYELENSAKEVRPWTWRVDAASGQVVCEMWGPPRDEPRYPYDADRIAALALATPIIVTEGEPSVDAVARAFPGCTGTTWLGGSGAVLRTDWSVLGGRRPVLVPDNDPSGRLAMAHLAGTLLALGTGYAWVEPGAESGHVGNVHRWDLAEPWKKVSCDAEARALTAQIARWRATLARSHPLRAGKGAKS